ncbi:MAG: EAL domain-containing protein [Nitrospiraceae bacterium]|nr:EAL domain-containing protein [Nitrospiraceae bacterium]
MRFAIDHFGSGFASFDYLRELPASFVKIGGEILLNHAFHGHVDRLVVKRWVRIF